MRRHGPAPLAQEPFQGARCLLPRPEGEEQPQAERMHGMPEQASDFPRLRVRPDAGMEGFVLGHDGQLRQWLAYAGSGNIG